MEDKPVNNELNIVSLITILNLKSLSLESCLHLTQGFLLNLLNSLLDGALVADRGAEYTQGSLFDILRQIRLKPLMTDFI
jgi:hypothetical protein